MKLDTSAKLEKSNACLQTRLGSSTLASTVVVHSAIIMNFGFASHRGVLVCSPPSTSQPGPPPDVRQRRTARYAPIVVTATPSENTTVRKDGSAEARGLREPDMEQPTLREQFESEPRGAGSLPSPCMHIGTDAVSRTPLAQSTRLSAHNASVVADMNMAAPLEPTPAIPAERAALLPDAAELPAQRSADSRHGSETSYY